MKFFSAKRSFGFIGGDDGVEVFLHASALPGGAVVPKPGTRVECGVADGYEGPQTLTVKILSPTRSISVTRRRKPQAIVPIAGNLIRLLDASSATLCNGEYPENSRATAEILRAMADDFDT